MIDPNLDTDMAVRILKVIRFKGFKSNASFADHMGWTRQYLNNILSGKNIGLSVVSSMCQKFPDISARWLILGDGIMLDLTNHLTALRSWVALADFIHVIPAEDRAKIDAGEFWSLDDLKRWELSLSEFNAAVEARLSKNSKIEQKVG